MNPDPKRVKDIFSVAVELPPQERAAYLDKACADDPLLRQRVEELLQAHDVGGSFLEQPAVEPVQDELETLPPTNVPDAPNDVESITLQPNESPAKALGPGTSIRYVGDYELLEEIARGGMGVVYKARQVSLNRVVAVKMILSGQLASEADVQRFYAEARAAGNLRHPNIVAIHEVGEFQGQHYFSMDYVDGQNLGQMVREHPLEPEQAARYVQIIALAIDMAHQNGTLHRDLKPSNVLIDRQDEPHVTDFGLARVVGQESGLTATGAVMGTPSYMPPEQARGEQARMGPACDVYSLGAILYELVTGRPPFKAATILDTLYQVSEMEVAGPRLLNPAINRDLETIILKCLDKDPARRYPTAAELAEDLQAFRAGRPIKARRPSLAERSFRWIKQQQGAFTLAVKTLALFLILGLTGVLTWRSLFATPPSRLHLDTAGPSLVAEVLHRDHDKVLARFRVPHEDKIALPAGSYRVRLSTPGTLDETFQLHLGEGEQRDLRVQLGTGQFWPSRRIESDERVDVLEGLPGSPADLIVYRASRAARIRGTTGKQIWEADFSPPQGKPQATRQRLPWPRDAHYQASPFSRLLRPAPDLDGDGTLDLVWFGNWEIGQNSGPDTIWALSGKDGKELWANEVSGNILGMPLLAKIDGDEPRDLIATVSYVEKNDPLPRCRIEGISGKDGSARWQFDLGPKWIGPLSKQGLAWQTRAAGGTTHIVCLKGTELVGLDSRTGKPAFRHELGFRPVLAPQFADLEGNGRPAALLMRQDADKNLSLVAMRLAQGEVMWERRLNMNVALAPVLFDFEGKGKMSVAVIDQQTTVPRYSGDAVTVSTGEPAGIGIDPVRFKGARYEPTTPGGDWAAEAVEILDGTTGKPLHTFKWDAGSGQVLRGARSPSQPSFVITGPAMPTTPIQGEPQRTFGFLLITATWSRSESRDGGSLKLHAHGLPTGAEIWTRTLEQPRFQGRSNSSEGELGLHGWWPAGTSLGQNVLVRTSARSLKNKDNFEDAILFVNPGTGNIDHRLFDGFGLEFVDIDGDGLTDLLYRTRNELGDLQLHAVRGGAKVAWQRFGSFQIAQDLDGDLVGDLMSLSGKGTTAISGMEGRVLWQNAIQPWRIMTPPLPDGDLNGDGTPDLLFLGQNDGWPTGPLMAVSGKDGKTLWRTDHLLGPKTDRFYRGVLAECRGGDVIYLYNTWNLENRNQSVGTGTSTSKDLHNYVAVLNGRDGTLRWRQECPGFFWEGDPARVILSNDRADLDGDGVNDFVVLLPSDRGLVVRAFSGKDGAVLWEQSFPPTTNELRQAGLVVGSFDGASPADVAVLLGHAGELVLLDGKDRKVKWRVPTTGAAGQQLVLADLDGTGKRSLCLSPAIHLTGQLAPGFKDANGRMVVVDHAGKMRTLAETTSSRHSTLFVPLRLENGKTAIVLTHRQEVLALASDGSILWRWQAPNGKEPVLIPPDPASKDRPPGVAVRCERMLFGLDGKSGTVQWRCDLEGIGGTVIVNRIGAGWPSIMIADQRSGYQDVTRVVQPQVMWTLSSRMPNPEELQRPLPWTESGWQHANIAAYLPGLLVLAVCVALGAWLNLARFILGSAVLGAVLALFLLAQDAGQVRPGQSYVWTGWYWMVAAGVIAVGWSVWPPLLLYGFLRLFGLRPRWVLRIGVPLMLLFMLAAVPFFSVRESSVPSVPPDRSLLLAALGVLLGGIVILGPGPALLRRFTGTSRLGSPKANPGE